MTQQPPVQTILNVQDGLLGLRYLKIVKSASGPHYVVDVMFKMGLRLTTDVSPGMPVNNIGEELDRKLRIHRPSEYAKITPAVDFVSDVASRVLSDEFGQIAERRLREDAIREAWEMTLFRNQLKTIDPRRILQYEYALECLEMLYSGSSVLDSSHGT